MRKCYTEGIEYVTYDYDDGEEFTKHRKVMTENHYCLVESYRLGRGFVATYSRQIYFE